MQRTPTAVGRHSKRKAHKRAISPVPPIAWPAPPASVSFRARPDAELPFQKRQRAVAADAGNLYRIPDAGQSGARQPKGQYWQTNLRVSACVLRPDGTA